MWTASCFLPVIMMLRVQLRYRMALHGRRSGLICDSIIVLCVILYLFSYPVCGCPLGLRLPEALHTAKRQPYGSRRHLLSSPSASALYGAVCMELCGMSDCRGDRSWDGLTLAYLLACFAPLLAGPKPKNPHSTTKGAAESRVRFPSSTRLLKNTSRLPPLPTLRADRRIHAEPARELPSVRISTSPQPIALETQPSPFATPPSASPS